jgi:hypothetical protein
MPFIIPKIIYDPGTGPVTLTFTYPPVSKEVPDALEALVHDSITSSGLRQRMVERVDTVKTLTMENVPWADAANWAAFINYALLGGSFSYYPDATATAFQTWELSDNKFSPTFNARGLSKFTLRIRQVPGGDFSL